MAHKSYEKILVCQGGDLAEEEHDEGARNVIVADDSCFLTVECFEAFQLVWRIGLRFHRREYGGRKKKGEVVR